MNHVKLALILLLQMLGEVSPNICSSLSCLFLYKPMHHVLHCALALEVELDVVQGCVYLLERCVSVEVGIAMG